MSEQMDSFSSGYIPDEDILRADTLDFAAIVEDVQSDGVGHTKAEVRKAICRSMMDLNKRGIYPEWQQGGTEAYVSNGLNRVYSAKDSQGCLLYPAVNAKHERKAEKFMDDEDYQYVIDVLFGKGDAMYMQGRIWVDRKAIRFQK